MGYNNARLQEACGDLAGAARQYQALLDRFPAYTDAALRLSHIAQAKGDIAAAVHWATTAMKAAEGGNDANAIAHLGASTPWHVCLGTLVTVCVRRHSSLIVLLGWQHSC
jgi:uncharacterized membrane-anchored protein